MTVLILTTLFVFLFYNEVTSDTNLYQEMKSLNASCFPLDSCKTLNHSRRDHLWNNRKCECGNHCVRFGTCCADSVHASEKFHLPLPEHDRCQKLEYFPTTVMMVSRCNNSRKWSSIVVKMCEKSNHSSYDRLLTSIPLTNVKTLTTYKNYFCALCNNGGKEFLFWRVGFKTKYRRELIKKLARYGKRFVLKNIKYNTRRKSWVFSNKRNGKSFKIKFQFTLPPYLRKMVKPCHVNLVQTCKSPHAESLAEQKCQAYYSPIEIKAKERIVVYKNIHCVMCNDVATSSVTISNCTKEISMATEESRTSFGVLVDINLNHGNKVGMTQVPEPNCGVNEVYDPFANRCREVVCAPGLGRVLVNGKCVPR